MKAHLPVKWQEGKVNGLCARGGFVVDEEWEAGKLTQAVITSTVGGVLRIRSYVPLTGKGLKIAKGNCKNHLLSKADIKKPLISTKVKETSQIPIQKFYEYDVITKAGEKIEVKPL